MAYDSKHTVILSPQEGYNLTENEYKKFWPHLNSFYSLNFHRFVPRIRENYRILDLWAGDGRMYSQLKVLEPSEYVACDCAEKLLAHHPGRIKKVICNLEESRPFEDQSFDLLSSFFLLEHIEDLEHFFQEAWRILDDKGQIFIGHFLQKRLFMRNIQAKRFKIIQYSHSIQEIEQIAQEAWFQAGCMPLYDVCNGKNMTGYFLVCEKNNLIWKNWF